MLSPEEAWERLTPHLTPLPEVTLRRQAALGRVLTRGVPATVDVPAEDVSAMDGYASGGVVAPGRRYDVVTTVRAGDPPRACLQPGEIARIMTGASLPDGADRVIPVERSDGGGEVVVFQSGEPEGAHIRRRGEIVRRDEEALPRGALLTPGALAVLATHGHTTVRVHRPPTVAVLSTGNEVVAPETEPGPGQLRDSHTDFLRAAVGLLDLEVRPLGIAPDDTSGLARLVATGLEADVLLLTGGVSKGAYDLVRDTLSELGCTVLFHGVAVQPGKPLLAARHRGGLVFGLPGNPNSVMATYLLFVRPALRRLGGQQDRFWEGALGGVLEAPLPGAKGRDRFLTATVAAREGRLLIRPSIPRGSHDLGAFARGTALVRIRAHSQPTGPGDPCEALPFL